MILYNSMPVTCELAYFFPYQCKIAQSYYDPLVTCLMVVAVMSYQERQGEGRGGAAVTQWRVQLGGTFDVA
jgi:hypothetical protein